MAKMNICVSADGTYHRQLSDIKHTVAEIPTQQLQLSKYYKILHCSLAACYITKLINVFLMKLWSAPEMQFSTKICMNLNQKYSSVAYFYVILISRQFTCVSFFYLKYIV